MKKQGCNADVVTLALEHDIDLISANGLIDKGWIDEFDKDSAVIKNDRLKAIYFKGEFGGFAIHLVQK